MTGWEYFAVCVERETSYENPSTIARRRPEAGDADAEWLTGEGRWQRTDAFVRRAEGFTDAELVPIGHDRARSIAATALAGGRIARVPDDLRSDGRRGRRGSSGAACHDRSGPRRACSKRYGALDCFGAILLAIVAVVAAVQGEPAAAGVAAVSVALFVSAVLHLRAAPRVAAGMAPWWFAGLALALAHAAASYADGAFFGRGVNVLRTFVLPGLLVAALLWPATVRHVLGDHHAIECRTCRTKAWTCIFRRIT